MLTRLATVKARLGLLETDVAHDEILANSIRAVSAWFDWECNRTLARTIDAVHEFGADEKDVRVPCYPVESIRRFELKSNEIEGWVAQPGVGFVLRRGCVLTLADSLGT